MKCVELKIDNNKLEIFLNIINNLKQDIVREISIKDSDSSSIATVCDAENEHYENLLKNMSSEDKEIASEKSFVI